MSEVHAHMSQHAAPRQPLSEADRFRTVGDHVDVPAEVAMRHPLYGVAGGLVVLAVFMIFDAIVAGLAVLVRLVAAAQGAAGPHLLFALIGAGFLVWAIVCIVKLFSRDPGFPRLFTVLCIVSLALAGIGILIAGFTWMALGQIVTVCIYIAYVQTSRRVRVTYRHQVEAADPILREPLPSTQPDDRAPAAAMPEGPARQFGGA